MANLKKNILYSGILTTANYIFPLITYPYVSRVLGVTNIGICNFIDSVINYFILFAMMGISAVGIREIAAASNDTNKRSQIFSSLFALNGITTLIMLIILLASIYLVPQLREYKDLMYIGAGKLVANLFLVEWFFKGVENFKYITNRTIIIKCLYVVSVFIFVKDADDYNIYFLLLALMVIINAIINFIYACSLIKFSLSNLSIKPYIKPYFTMGCYMLLTSMYTSFNVTYLGFVSGETEVGYYTTSTKIHTIILMVFTAVTGVMMPRIASILSERKYGEYKRLIKKSLNVLLVFAIPCVILIEILAPYVIRVIAGPGYDGAVLPLRIIAPLILIIGIEQVLIIQSLIPMGKDKAVLINSIIGALVGILANIIFVPCFASVGSAIVWLMSEFAVMLSAYYFFRKEWKSLKTLSE